ncbi:MAG TPA: hypothetical protein PK523_12225, partial [Elusimicrobiales bacterium]|nr:hypothetical protein [Elusimicrobiales bacterium]
RVKRTGVIDPATDVSTERTELPGYSLRPAVEVTAGPASGVKVSLLAGGTNITGARRYTPDPDDVEVRAGNLVNNPANLGRVKLQGLVVDAFDNPVRVAGATTYLEIVDVSPSGLPGALRLGASYQEVGLSTTVLTDADGLVGVSTSVWYFVNTVSTGTRARVWIGTSPPSGTEYETMTQNITPRFTTIGGDIKRVLFDSVPPLDSATAGIQAAYTVRRVDDFGNPVVVGLNTINLSIPAAEENVHSLSGFAKATTGNPAMPPYTYGFFLDPGNIQFRTTADIPDGCVLDDPVLCPTPSSDRVSFFYRDFMASTPLTDGRASTWTVTAGNPSGVPSIANAVHALKVNPAVTDRLRFDNAKMSFKAGEPIDPVYGLNNILRLELRDAYENPTPATMTVTVALASSRTASDFLDAHDFSLSPARASDDPPAFSASTDTLTIPLGQYYATFYYLDTRASFDYGASSTTMPVLIASVPAVPAWSRAEQSEEIVARDNSLGGRLGLYAPAEQLTAGVTSQ